MNATTEILASESNASAIIDAARAHAAPVGIDPTDQKIVAFIVPEGCKLETVDPDDRYLEAPRQLHGKVTVGDVASFQAYVSEFYDDSMTTAWVDAEKFRVDALLNDASRTVDLEPWPAWRDHRATLQLVKTPEWERWRGLNTTMVDQERFARHIEVSEEDITDPSAADLLEIASSFYATTSAEVRSAKRLHSGETQLEWIEETNATAGNKKQLAVPKEFTLRIAPFVGEQPVDVRALFRYRLTNGALKLGYELVRPDDIERAVMNAVAETLRGDIKRVYIGSPRRPAADRDWFGARSPARNRALAPPGAAV